MSGAWKLVFPDIVKSDFAALAVPVRAQVLKMINRVATNPLPQARGGYGNRLAETSPDYSKSNYDAPESVSFTPCAKLTAKWS